MFRAHASSALHANAKLSVLMSGRSAGPWALARWRWGGPGTSTVLPRAGSVVALHLLPRSRPGPPPAATVQILRHTAGPSGQTPRSFSDHGPVTISSPPLSFQRSSMPVPSPVPVTSPSLPVGSSSVVYCEGQFGEQDGKTANGLVRHSEKYDDPQRHRQPACRRRRRGPPRRHPQRNPGAGGPCRGRRARRPRARLPYLRPGTGRRAAGAGPAGGAARRHRAGHARDQRAPRVPQRRRRVRGGRPPARRDHHRRTPPSRQEGPPALLRTDLRSHLPTDSRPRHRRGGRQAHHRHPAGPRPQ